MYTMTRKEFEIIHGRYYGMFRRQTFPSSPQIIVFLLFMGMNVSPPCMYTYHVCAWCRQKTEEGMTASRTELQMGVSCPIGTGN